MDATVADIQAVLKTAPPDAAADLPVRVVDVGGYHVGVYVVNRPKGVANSAIYHETKVTEVYHILKGSGTLVTGGKIVNGNKSGPDAQVTTELNGPSCSGTAIGADIVKKAVKTGDIIIIPAGVPHGWTDITDHVDYLSFRPSQRVLTAGYVHPSIKK